MRSFPLPSSASSRLSRWCGGAVVRWCGGVRASIYFSVCAPLCSFLALLEVIFVYAILFAISPLPRFLAALAPSPSARLLLLAAGSALEVYLMSVMSVALVVSVAEERFGWDAIRAGSALMEGNRVCGWALSGLFVLGSSLIGSKVERLMDGGDWIRVEDKANVIVWYGLLVLWSYVIMTVFYYDCRKRHPIREPQPEELQLSIM